MSVADPQRGDIWYIDLDPTKGREMNKQRPAVVLSSDAIGVLPLKIVVPLTGWDSKYEGKVWLVEIAASQRNGLTKISAADALQVRSVDKQRFTRKIGVLEGDLLEQVAAALAIIVEVR